MEEADAGDLEEVLERVPPGPHRAHQADGEAVVMGEELTAEPWITTGGVLNELPLDVLPLPGMTGT